MMTFLNNWWKQILIHHASSNRSHGTNINRNCLVGDNITDRCTIVDRPSTMADADAMNCDDAQNENKSLLEKNSQKIKSFQKDTVVIDKFQACFLDCSCQCEARKVIPPSNTNQSKNITSQLFDELFDQRRGPSYEIDCCCNCGKKGMRKLTFNYATGNKTNACY